MRSFIYHFVYALMFSIVFSLTCFGQSNRSIEGSWLGTLDAGGAKLRLVLKVSKSADGALAAKLDSIDQGANDLDIDVIRQQEKAVHFEAHKYGMGYDGTLSEKGDEISGTFKQGASALPLIFKRTVGAIKLNRPQDPQPPYPYSEEEISYKNTLDNVKLAGTLSLPPRTAGRRHPAVILITGSGSQDRNETIAGHRPFLVLADYLTRRGVAVLRIDDRGIGGSDLGSPRVTSENFTNDVLAGVEYLKTRPEINPRKIGLVGHSEGGMIAPMAARRSKDIAFIVLMAGLGQTGEDVIYTQSRLLQKAAGVSPELNAQNVEVLKNIYAILKIEPDDKLAEQKIHEMLEKQESRMNEEQRKTFNQIKKTVESQIPIVLSPWFRYFIAYDPRPTLEKVRVPVLAINGENDLQVAYKENLNSIAAALKAGGNKDYTIKSFPKLNHLFQTSETGAPGEYGTIEETISPQVLESIADWILKRTIER